MTNLGKAFMLSLSMLSLHSCFKSLRLSRTSLNLRSGLFMSDGVAEASTSSSSSGGRVSAAVAALNRDESVFQTKLDLNPPKGTRDFYPEDKRLSNWLFNHFHKIAKSYGFEEYDAPVLEKEVLYIRKSGDEVTGQLYNFVDKGDNRVSLRPEMTPSLARMVLARKNQLSLPLKWYSIPQCWRYERMTRGRRREHYQWNMDIWGVQGVEAEAELLSAIVTCFQDLGLTSQDVGIKINSRKILEAIMKAFDIPESKWGAACVLVDKLDKQSPDAILKELIELGVKEESGLKLIETIQKKEMSNLITILGPESEGLKDIQKVLSLAKAYQIEDWINFDASVVRGLSYYTGIVFEGYDKSGQLRAICGGGRYDQLLDTMSAGEDSLSAVGFGFGDAVIVELLKMKKLLPDTSINKIDALVYYMSASNKDANTPEEIQTLNLTLQMKAISAAKTLRSQGLVVDIVMEDKKPKWAFQRADKLKADYVVMFASSEVKNNEVVIKNMKEGTQVIVPEASLVENIMKK